MRVISIIGVFGAAALTLTGCMSAEDENLEGVTLGAGNAIAINSSLQVIDPWPAGVQDTNIGVPADRGSETPAGGGESAKPAVAG